VKKLKIFLRKYFITGLLVVVPVTVTVLVLRSILSWIDSILGDIPTYVIGVRFPGLGIITLILFILSIGFISANYFGNRILQYWDELMQKVPLVRGVYSTVKQVMETFSVKQNFHGVALVEYPRAGCYSIGFVTGDVAGGTWGFPETTRRSLFRPPQTRPPGSCLFSPWRMFTIWKCRWSRG
jgi:uncharacterized membrane protein